MTSPHKKFGARHKARKRAVDLLFEAEARGIGGTELLADRLVIAGRDADVAPINDYTVTLVRGVADNQQHLDDVIAGHLHEWSLERLPAVDRAVLRLAVWELFYGEDVPPVVAVDEAIELAKTLSTDDSPGFINGVLGQIVLIAPQVRAAANATLSTDPPADED